MHRSLTLIPLASLVLGACAADNGDEGILITKNVAAGDSCTFSAEENSAFIPRGTFSLDSPVEYRLHPQMRSRITAAAGMEEQRTILVRGGRVELSFTDANLFSAAELEDMRSSGVTRFENRFSAPISPGGLTDGEVGVIFPNLLARLAEKNTGGGSFSTEVIVSLVVFGSLGSGEVTSQAFEFPVTVCNDCVQFVIGSCPLPMDTPVRTGNSCSPYQDGVVDCCTFPGGVACPATVSTI